MKYFFLAYALIAVLFIGLNGFRGDKSSKPPIRLFPDMDEQDKVKGQRPSDFFRDGFGSRKPVAGTIPHSSDDGVFPVEFGEGREGYYYTGRFGDFYGKGMPEELQLTEDNAEAFLRRGEERFGIYCAVCHGESGNGKGTISNYGLAGIANLYDYPAESYPNGRLYDVISHGKGNMSGYGYNIPVRDRWAIVAYVRALQASKK